MSYVTRCNYPAIFECFESIAHDTGMGAGNEKYFVPDQWISKLDCIESKLKILTKRELEIFSTGSDQEINEFLKNTELTSANELLNHFFNEWLC